MAVSKCISLSNENRLDDISDSQLFRIDETGCHGTPDFPVAAYLDDVTKDYVNWHWHDEPEIGFVTEGSVIMGSGTGRQTLNCGDVFFINAGVMHSMCNAAPPENAVFKSIAFGSSIVGGAQESVFWQKYAEPVIHSENLRSLVLPCGSTYHESAKKLIADVWSAMADEPAHFEMLVRNGLSSLFCMLLSAQEQADAADAGDCGIRLEKRMHVLLDYIHARYSGHISLEELARAADVSQTEVMRCFKSIIGKSPMRYLMEYRLRQAAYLILHTRRPIRQIAEECGFEDSSYFARAFRAMYHMPPTQYRSTGKVNVI